VQRLEREIGAPLFDRTSRRVALTAAGERFVVRAQRVLAKVDDLAEVAASCSTSGGSGSCPAARRWPTPSR
jgi:DNA-binding transcriptional LysR family regulator